MSRLIDAKKLRADFLGMPNCYNGFSDSYDKAMIVDMVDEQPTIDAVPVVRCKECKHFREHDEIYKRMWKSEYDGHCMWWNAHSTHADGYCHEWKEKEVE